MENDILANLTTADKNIVMSLAECNMNLSECARATRYTYSTVRYHMLTVRMKSGCDPTTFFGLSKLVEAIQKERNTYDREGS